MDKIAEESDLNKKEIKKKIEEKRRELSGLVSEEGAAYIVSRETGVELLKEGKRELQVENLVSGLRSVNLRARVVRIFEPREFESKGKKGKVANIIVGDGTGTVRLSLWNEEVELIEKEKIKEGDVVEVSGGYVKTDNRGQPELRTGRGEIGVVEEETDLPKVEEIQKGGAGSAGRKDIGQLKEGDYAQVRGALVQVFERKPLYEICPECEGRVRKEKDKWECREHGEVEPAHHMMASGVIDDGTGNVRAVFFREMAENILGKKTGEVEKEIKKDGGFQGLFEGVPALGKEFIFKGSVKKNDFTENLEFMVNEMEEINVKEETEKLLQDVGK